MVTWLGWGTHPYELSLFITLIKTSLSLSPFRENVITFYVFIKPIFLTVIWLPPRPTLDHNRGGSLTHPMLITVFLHIRPEDLWEPHNNVGSLSLTGHLGDLNWKPSDFYDNFMKVTFATKWQLLKMCHLRHGLRNFLFHRKVLICSQDIQVFVFLPIPEFIKFVTSWWVLVHETGCTFKHIFLIITHEVTKLG